jgi:glutaredoxin-like protein NrdH
MRVSVYTLPNCVQCESTKRMLKSNNIRYDEIALDQHPELAEQFKSIGHASAPVVVATSSDSEYVWSGFRYDKIKALATKLFGEQK